MDYPVPRSSAASSANSALARLATRLVKLASALRRLTDQDLEETVSTRLLVVAARLVASGLPELAAGRVAIVDALTDDAETAAALNEVVLAAFHPGD